MQAKFNGDEFREIENVGEYNKFAEGGLWIKFKGAKKIFHCENIDEENFAIIHAAFSEELKNEENECSDDNVFEKIEEAEKEGLIKR